MGEILPLHRTLLLHHSDGKLEIRGFGLRSTQPLDLQDDNTDEAEEA